MSDSPNRLLVHFHVYYTDQVPYFLERLSHICGCEWDLYVTYSTEDRAMREAVSAFRPDTVFLQVDNRGYDIWPFISVLRTVDFGRYAYVLKLHTKHPVNDHLSSVQLSGYKWRNMLVDAILKSPAQFRKALGFLEEDASAGLVCNGLLLRHRRDILPEDNNLLEAELDRMGLQVGKSDPYCAGTMFLARLAPFAALRDAPVDAASYSANPQPRQTGTLAHVQERICTYVVTAAGYRVVGTSAWPVNYALMRFWMMLQPAAQFLFKIDREGPEQVKTLTILGFRFRLEKNGRAGGNVENNA